MDDTVRRITAEDINPRYNWGRALPALGIMGVDFEERVDYRRLHRYRLSRVKQALENSDLGALLVVHLITPKYAPAKPHNAMMMTAAGRERYRGMCQGSVWIRVPPSPRLRRDKSIESEGSECDPSTGERARGPALWGIRSRLRFCRLTPS